LFLNLVKHASENSKDSKFVLSLALSLAVVSYPEFCNFSLNKSCKT
jgi:hypothetical protein